MTKKEAERILCRKIDLRTNAGKADFLEACRRDREDRRRIIDNNLREKLHAGQWYVVDSDRGGILLTAGTTESEEAVLVPNGAGEAGLPINLESLAEARKEWKGTRFIGAKLYYNTKTGRFLCFDCIGGNFLRWDVEGPEDPNNFWVDLVNHDTGGYFPLTSWNLWNCLETGINWGYFKTA